MSQTNSWRCCRYPWRWKRLHWLLFLKYLNKFHVLLMTYTRKMFKAITCIDTIWIDVKALIVAKLKITYWNNPQKKDALLLSDRFCGANKNNLNIILPKSSRRSINFVFNKIAVIHFNGHFYHYLTWAAISAVIFKFASVQLLDLAGELKFFIWIKIPVL